MSITDWHKVKGLKNFVSKNFLLIIKFQFIQSTSDGIMCTQKLNFNENTIWEQNLNCPKRLDQPGIYITGDDSRVTAGQIKNFKFYTYEI